MLVTNLTVHWKPNFELWRHLCSSSESFLPPPTSRELHLWCVLPDEVHQTNLLCSYVSILPCEERSIAYQTNNKKVQKEYLLTRILARTLLARYSGGLVDPSALRFGRGSHGKPRIVWPIQSVSGKIWNPPKISFNISHTRSLIVCAITGAPQVGIDVEQADRATHTDLLRFARRKFSDREAAQLEQLDLEARKRHFLQLWTLKESYGKAVGNGILGSTLRDAAFAFDGLPPAFDLQEYLTGIQAHKQAFAIKPDGLIDGELWQFVLLQLTNLHNVATCVQQDLSVKGPCHVQIMKTIPLVKDEPFLEAVALGLSI